MSHARTLYRFLTYPSRVARLGIIVVAVAGAFDAALLEAQTATAVPPKAASANEGDVAPLAKGQRVFVCGHSFHVFLAEPLASLAREAGYSDHVMAGTSSLGGSRPLQHWNRTDDKNPKHALEKGSVDVLTLAPNLILPDEGIDRFADLAVEHNPAVRVLLQLSWLPFDGANPRAFRVEDRDAITLDELRDVFPAQAAEYIDRLRKQAAEINDRHKRPFVFIVPAGKAVLQLREAVVEGHAPGIAKQSELFRDGLGHGNLPIRQLVTYCWFAAIYHRSPEGLKALVANDDANSPALQRLLQQIAWQCVLAEPMNGLEAQ